MYRKQTCSSANWTPPQTLCQLTPLSRPHHHDPYTMLAPRPDRSVNHWPALSYRPQTATQQNAPSLVQTQRFWSLPLSTSCLPPPSCSSLTQTHGLHEVQAPWHKGQIDLHACKLRGRTPKECPNSGATGCLVAILLPPKCQHSSYFGGFLLHPGIDLILL